MEIVCLEPIASEHASDVQLLASDPAIGATSNVPSPYPPDGATSWIHETVTRREAGGEYTFAIKAGDRLVGVCGLVSVSGDAKSAELGYWIGKPFWGKGYATAGATLALGFGFQQLDLRTVRSSCLVRNRPSRRVLEKLGFRITAFGTSTNPKWGPEDRLLLFELSRREWERSGDLVIW